MRTVRKVAIGITIGLAAVMLLVLLGVSVFQERLRDYVEHELNARIDRYDTRIGTLTVRPLILAGEIEHLTARLKDHPDPPVIDMPRARAEITWRGLLHGTLVGAIAMDHP